ncbi:MAG TPA: GDYXXLXY domain-containing protein [Usitatibacter sp.]
MNITRALILLGAAIVLAAINVSIMGKESIRHNGEIVYLDLAPRDPRSLMQGDYMALRFRLAQEIEASLHSGAPVNPVLSEGQTGFANIALDEKRVASLAKPGAASNLRIRYRLRKGAVWLGTNAFFFEEGTDSRYASARYGEFRLDAASGEAVLVGLRDAKFGALN